MRAGYLICRAAATQCTGAPSEDDNEPLQFTAEDFPETAQTPEALLLPAHALWQQQPLPAATTPAPPAASPARRGIAADADLLLVLPGSRPSEIRLMTPVYEGAVAQLKRARPALEVAVVAAGTVADDVAGRIASWPFRVHLVSETEKYDAMKAATVALATSGTVSTELALAGAPMVIGYRFQPLSYAIMKPFFTGKYATLFNHAADEEIARELIQNDATPEKVAAEVERLLADPEARRTQAERQTAALDLMGRNAPDPSSLAADAVLRVIAARAGR